MPATGSTTSSNTVSITYNVTGDDDRYYCTVYSNDSGSWATETSSEALNNTNTQTSAVFTNSPITWNLRCNEVGNSNIYGWATTNQTLSIATGEPSITINSPANNSYQNGVPGTDAYSGTISLTVTDTNANQCELIINGTVNSTGTSYTSGSALTLNFNASDGNYFWNVSCNDTGGNQADVQRTINIDTVTPVIVTGKQYLN